MSNNGSNYMSQTFQIQLSTDKAPKCWGETQLTYNENGAFIHIQSLENCKTSLQRVQLAARKIVAHKIPHISLVGEWPLEYQWHFWQGLSDPCYFPELELAPLAKAEAEQLNAMIKTYSWVKSLVNQTPEDIFPHSLCMQVGEYLTQLAPNEVSYEIMTGEALKDAGYTGIYNVGRGSRHEPALLTLDFIPKGSKLNSPAAVLVGKGITFDSGGYSLKQSQGMLHMKADMGGAATVSGALALAIINGLKSPVRLILCCAENMVSGEAYKLSEILKYRNGVSVEVVNTDAEGRLVLADGLIDACNSKTPLIIDAATLTGAAVTAVGEDYNAVFSMDDELCTEYLSIARKNYDQAWRLPLDESHKNNCPSAYADTANSKPIPGGGPGGASNAAGFLSRFIETPNKGWLHIDLAACYHANANAYFSAGATGRGTRSIASLLMNLSDKG
ncbi:aminopeptidase PepB [Aliikangiella sp. G2MR2-5]|uniref:aminopeptidase PepB n=1 Tax=Aliikangiella sp. G2MR2-5 TaxID=2788943 RepID=UPI001FEDB5C3|nr:aminopeptidase PepB [Aliikangiella sp. G2MR2-5]